jgi:hypothetical protein
MNTIKIPAILFAVDFTAPQLGWTSGLADKNWA